MTGPRGNDEAGELPHQGLRGAGAGCDQKGRGQQLVVVILATTKA